ncbi:MAG: site-specific DNA-methyltransferase [Armatimonadetes bacterium]|nr:site-specific DNA-methyltransferase [Armatimonadota bacterium]
MENSQLSLLSPIGELPGHTIDSVFLSDSSVILHLGDTLEFLRTVPDKVVTLGITSPPYNIGKEYETRQSIHNYLQEQTNVIDELIRILKDNGSICWQVGNYVQEGEVFPLDIFYYEIFKERGLKLRNRIIWFFRHGLHASKRFSGRYETLLWFTKSDDYKFNLDAVRVPAKYPGKRHFKGANKGKLSSNPLGKNPSDIWEIVAQDWESGIWDIPNVKANHPEKTVHPCQFPIELVERCVLSLTDEEDWIVDPYCGVGSSLIAGIKNSRKAMGCDKESRYITIANERIQDYYRGNLKIRPLGKEVHVPSGKEKVAQIPDEWRTQPTQEEDSLL